MISRRVHIARVVCSLLLLCVAGAALLADEWPAPQVREVFSVSRNHFVRVTPGDSWGDAFGFAGSPKGPYTTAQFYERQADGAYWPGAQITLVNPVAPVDFFVSDDGHLALLDNWHNRGYGKVFALYSPSGALLRAYELSELFSKEEIDAFEHSASSIQWHTGPAYLQADQKSLFVMIDGKGGDISFDVQTGAYRYCEWHGSATNFACRDANAGRVWRPFKSNE